jgi:hypothetical protein
LQISTLFSTFAINSKKRKVTVLEGHFEKKRFRFVLVIAISKNLPQTTSKENPTKRK